MLWSIDGSSIEGDGSTIGNPATSKTAKLSLMRRALGSCLQATELAIELEDEKLTLAQIEQAQNLFEMLAKEVKVACSQA